MGFSKGASLPGMVTRSTKGTTASKTAVRQKNGSVIPPSSKSTDARIGPTRNPTISQAASRPSISPALAGLITKAKRRMAGRTAPAPKPKSTRARIHAVRESATHIQPAPIMLTAMPIFMSLAPWPVSASRDNVIWAKKPAKKADAVMAPTSNSVKPKIARSCASSVKIAA